MDKEMDTHCAATTFSPNGCPWFRSGINFSSEQFSSAHGKSTLMLVRADEEKKLWWWVPEPICLGACLYYWQQLLFRNSSRVVKVWCRKLFESWTSVPVSVPENKHKLLDSAIPYKWQQCGSEMALHTFRGAKRIYPACCTVLYMPCFGLFALMKLIMCRTVISIVFLLSLWFNEMIVAVRTRSGWYMWFLAKPIWWAANSP